MCRGDILTQDCQIFFENKCVFKCYEGSRKKLKKCNKTGVLKRLHAIQI